MTILAAILFLCSAAGLAALGARYAFGPAPTDYHAQILRRGGAEIHAEVVRVTGASNRVLGASLFALATAMAGLALFGVMADAFWAKATLLAATLILGLPALQIARRMQAETGVTTPVRPTAALIGVSVLAFVLSLI
jgi:hypothetical protein